MTAPRADLVAFLRARLAEDERAAQAAAALNPPPWEADHGWIVGGETPEHQGTWPGGLWDNEGAASLSMRPPVAEHIVRHDPARVLVDIEARRALLDAMVGPALSTAVAGTCDAGLATARFLAAVYAEHPDYRPEEWAL